MSQSPRRMSRSPPSRLLAQTIQATIDKELRLARREGTHVAVAIERIGQQPLLYRVYPDGKIIGIAEKGMIIKGGKRRTKRHRKSHRKSHRNSHNHFNVI